MSQQNQKQKIRYFNDGYKEGYEDAKKEIIEKIEKMGNVLMKQPDGEKVIDCLRNLKKQMVVDEK